MDDIQKRLTQMLEEWPDCVDDRRQFRSLLQDYIPQNKLQAKLLLNAYDKDVVTQLKLHFMRFSWQRVCPIITVSQKNRLFGLL